MNTTVGLTPNYRSVLSELKAVARADKAEFLPQFFQAFPGGYGEGDKFLGVVVPDQRRIAKRFRSMPSKELSRLLRSPWHECRLTGLFILVIQYEQLIRQNNRRDAQSQAGVLSQESECIEFYLEHLDGVNNWDLVDSSAHKLLGRWVLRFPEHESQIFELSECSDLWRQRISVVANYALIQQGQFGIVLQLAEKFLEHSHDLMHKAVGWMLREAGKQDSAVLNSFLSEHAADMPRTMLRYSIEKLPKSQRQRWLKRK